MTGTQKQELMFILRDEINVLEEQAEEKTFKVENFADEADFASQLTQQDVDVTIQRRCRNRLNELEVALNRLQNDSYGVCDECGDDISVARLKANPSARLCVVCQSEVEDGLRPCA